MYATIQRWGNSQGLRIPKALLDALGLRENDRIELIQSDDGIHIRKAAAGHRRGGGKGTKGDRTGEGRSTSGVHTLPPTPLQAGNEVHHPDQRPPVGWLLLPQMDRRQKPTRSIYAHPGAKCKKKSTELKAAQAAGTSSRY